jgi:ElaB/YqjD/DUF883 family membrane-anchored ribosome-binding protein
MKQSHEREAAAPRAAEAASARLPRELRATAEAAGSDREQIDAARRRQFREVRRQASASWQRAGDAARACARENPGAATLAAFGVGLGVGCLLARRRSSTAAWRGVVPAVSAIAHGLLDVFDRRR